MYIVNDMPPQIDRALIEKLSRVEPATIGHFRHHGFMDPDLRPVIADAGIVAGTAVTVQMPGADGTIGHVALGTARPGDFLIIDRCGDRWHAAWGGVVAFGAREAGVVGVILDGRVCDPREIHESGVNVWCKGLTAITCKKLGLGGALNIPVTCGGVTVKPGDAVVADDSGIVVLDPADVAEVADIALAMQEEEKTVTLPRIRAGEKVPDVTGATALVEQALKARKP